MLQVHASLQVLAGPVKGQLLSIKTTVMKAVSSRELHLKQFGAERDVYRADTQRLQHLHT